MSKTTTIRERKPSPTLNTVAMVEVAIKAGGDEVMSAADIKRALPKQINHYTISAVLEYLEQEGKITVTLGGIRWKAATQPTG